MGCGGSKDEKKPQEDKKKEQDKKNQEKKDAKAASPKEDKAGSPAAGESAPAAAAGDSPVAASRAVAAGAAAATPSGPDAEYPVEEDGKPGSAHADTPAPESAHEAPALAGEPSAAATGATMETMDATPATSIMQDRDSHLRPQQSGVAAGATMETMDATPATSVMQSRQAPAGTSAPAAHGEDAPTVSVVKRRPSRPTRAVATPNAAGTSAVAPRSVPTPASTGAPVGNYEDYSPRQATVTQPVLDAEGKPMVDAEGNAITQEVPAPAPQEDIGGGQLIERKEPVWTVARPPPPTQGWVLLRQVRVVMQMRKLTAI